METVRQKLNKYPAARAAWRCWRSARRWGKYAFRSIDRATRQSRRYDRCTIEIMSRVLTKKSNCVDVGCHAGSILRHMLELAPDGAHFAFEPLPHFAARLRQDFPTVNIFEVALSDVDGSAEFHHAVNRPAFSGLRRHEYPSKDEQIELISVRTQRLDDLLPPSTQISFIKADVEGGELQVFKGAMRTISAHKPHIVFEMGLGGANYYGNRPEAMYDLLVGQCGLQISLLDGWLDGRNPLTRAELVEQFDRHVNYYFLAHP